MSNSGAKRLIKHPLARHMALLHYDILSIKNYSELNITEFRACRGFQRMNTLPLMYS
jgi:hypothetical protein